MAGPPNGSYGLVSAIFTGPNVPTGALCTFGVEIQGATPTEVPEAFTGAFGPLMQSTAVTQVAITKIRLKIGPEATGPVYERAVNLPGNQGSDSGGPQVALLVRKKVDGVTGRRWGRVFWPGLSDFGIGVDGVLEGPTLTQYQNAFTAFHYAMENAGFPLRVFPGVGSDPDVVSQLLVQGRIATQRLRVRR